jgi:hypothetical protein
MTASDARRAYIVSKNTVKAIAQREAAKAGGTPTAASLESGHTRAELVRLAEARGLDTEGTKADLAKSIAKFDKG